VRAGNVYIVPGYDGEYGKVKIFEEVERKEIKGQKRLF
jgi:PHP family Zn ribbon phosphoesterase